MKDRDTKHTKRLDNIKLKPVRMKEAENIRYIKHV